jgi:hypothetical protein
MTNNWTLLDQKESLYYYWLGWMVTDGCIMHRFREGRNRGIIVALTMHRNDEHILDFFRDQIRPDAKYAINGNCSMLSLALPRRYANELAKFGLVQRKTINLKVTNTLKSMPKEAFLQYLVGIIEGDGCVDIRMLKSKGYEYSVPRIRVTNNSKPFLEWIARKCEYYCGVKRRKPYKRQGCECWELGIAGKDAIELHKQLSSCQYRLLERKWKLIEPLDQHQ